MTDREAQLTAEVERYKSALDLSQREIALLRQKVDLLVRRIFGSSSERIDPKQMQLLLLGEQASTPSPEQSVTPAAPVSTATRPAHRERTPRLPQNLPVVEEIIDPEPVKAEPAAWRCIGQEVSEQLDYEPGRFLRRRLIRRTYVHRRKQDLAPVTAPLPQRLQDRGVAAPGLLAQVIVSKYCDHLPLYRQEQIFKSRYRVHLPRQTLDRWVVLAADWLKPVYQQIRTGVMAGGYLQIDETPIEYLEPGFGRTRQGYFWCCNRPGGDVIFQWETSRATDCLDKLLAVDFRGTIQSDGYSAYRAFADRRANAIKLAGCWAHARRKFHEALEECARTAGWILRQIGHLYEIEARLRAMGAGPKLRLIVRQQQSRPVIERIGKALERLKATRRPLPQSLLGKAIDYAQSQWAGLLAYLEDGRIEIDNNLVENAIRPTAIGKKNWLFVGESQAGERGAILYTIIESCRRQQIDPFAYLRDILTRLPAMTNQQLATATPAAWAKAQSLPLRAAS